MAVADTIVDLLGPASRLAVRAYDGSEASPPSPVATLILRSPDALRRLLTAPGELGLGRAYVAGDLDTDGDIYGVLECRDVLEDLHIGPRQWLGIARLIGAAGIRRVPPPPEEAHLRGR